MPPNENASAQQTTQETVVAPKDDFQLASDANKSAENSETQEATEVESTESENTSEESETTENEENASETESEEEELAAGEEKTGDKEPGRKNKGGVQKRIDKLTKRNSNLARELELTKRLLLEKANQSGEQTRTAETQDKTPVKVDESTKPKRDAFETSEAYYEALTDWKVDQKLAAKDERSTKQKAEDTAKADAETLKKNHLSRVEKYQKDNPDFVEAMEDFKTAPIALNVQFALMESEHGPELMHEFAKTPETLERLNKLSAAQINREIGRLEAKFSSSEKTETTTQAAPAKKVTKAPAPITPVQSRAGHVKTSRDNLPYDEWVKVRRSEMKDR